MLLKRFSKRFIRHPRSAWYALLCYVFKVKSNKIVFSNFMGNGYGDNPKYIAEEILKKGLNYDIVWLVRQYYDNIPDAIRQVKITSILGAYELSTAKVIVINSKGALPFFKKERQYMIQTWHSTYGPKYVEKDAMDILPSKYIKDSIENSQETDLFLSPCKLQTEEFRHAFWCECEVMPSGIPRNDIYFKENGQLIEITRKKIGVPIDVNILIYAPTLRDNKATDVYSSLNFEEIQDALEKKYGGKWYILIRLHPGIAYDVDLNINFNDSIINVSSYDDIQEILLASSFLITDYSSIMFDFYLLKKPVFLYTPDVDSPEIRGLRPMFNDFPFVHCKTQTELLSAIDLFDMNRYLSEIDEFDKLFGSYDDGNASEKVVERIIKIMK